MRVVLVLVTCDLALLDTALDDRPALGRVLGAMWPTAGTCLHRRFGGRATRSRPTPRARAGGARFFVVEEPRTLVGWGGFKGPPSDGVVELGYAVAPAWEGRGVATVAVRELVREAFAAPAV